MTNRGMASASSKLVSNIQLNDSDLFRTMIRGETTKKQTKAKQ